MLARLSPPLVAFGGSVALFVGLVGAIYWTTRDANAGVSAEPLIVYCAEAMRLPMDAIAKDYEKETGQKVRLHFGPSQTILANLKLSEKGDLFLPADDSFIRLAKKDKLVQDVQNLARMHAVIIVRPDFPKTIGSWGDFIAAGNKIGLANTESTAIGKLVKQQLQSVGMWEAVHERRPTYLGNVNEVANAVQLGTIDVGIVWDVTAHPHAKLTVVKLKELEPMQAHVKVALAKCSTQPDHARKFVRYIRAKDKGALHLRKQGYSDIDEGGAMDNRPELVVYAGSMLRPALEQSLNDFEKREGVRITRVYNGCGILVASMKTGETPDVYFACDLQFMDQVKDLFNNPTSVSNNLLVITVKKGNPKKVYKLIDLAKPGLRVGVGHEHQCALGTLTKETFIKTGVYAKVIENVVVQSPTGDFLVNQLRTGSLDVVVVYKSNVTPFADELEGIPITGIPCAAPQQPIAVSKNSAHPELSRKLMDYLKLEESKERFQKLGFGWELKEVEAK